MKCNKCKNKALENVKDLLKKFNKSDIINKIDKLNQEANWLITQISFKEIEEAWDAEASLKNQNIISLMVYTDSKLEPAIYISIEEAKKESVGFGKVDL